MFFFVCMCVCDINIDVDVDINFTLNIGRYYEDSCRVLHTYLPSQLLLGISRRIKG